MNLKKVFSVVFCSLLLLLNCSNAEYVMGGGISLKAFAMLPRGIEKVFIIGTYIALIVGIILIAMMLIFGIALIINKSKNEEEKVKKYKRYLKNSLYILIMLIAVLCILFIAMNIEYRNQLLAKIVLVILSIAIIISVMQKSKNKNKLAYIILFSIILGTATYVAQAYAKYYMKNIYIEDFDFDMDISRTPISEFNMGENVTARLYKDGDMIISGTGDIKDYKENSYDFKTSQYVKNEEKEFEDTVKVVKIEEGITGIGRYTFMNCQKLLGVEIPNSLIAIEDGAFNECLKLREVKNTGNIEEIGNSAFSGCERLEIIDLSKNVKTIGRTAFWACKNLKSIELSENIERIEDETFDFCEELITIQLPSKLCYIGKSAFGSCKKLDNIIIPNSVTQIGENAFSYCENLSNIVLSNNLEIIPESAFIACGNLKKIVIPESVKSIETYAFSGCKLLDEVIIKNGVKEIGLWVFPGCDSLKTLEIPNSVIKMTEPFYKCDGLEKVIFKDRGSVSNMEIFEFVFDLSWDRGNKVGNDYIFTKK